jgi:hypothetical protein
VLISAFCTEVSTSLGGQYILRLLGDRNAPYRELEQSSSHTHFPFLQVSLTCFLLYLKFKSYFVFFVEEEE